MSGLTDEERELKRLAEEAERYDARSEGSFRAKSRMWGALGPATVLRLLARIEELEEQVASMEYDALMGRLYEGGPE